MDRNVRKTMHARLDELKTLRDEVRLELQLAGMDLRDEWRKLERRMPEASRLAAELKGVTVEALDELVAELRLFRNRLSSRDQGSGKTASPR